MRQALQLVLAALLVLVLGYVGYRLVFSEDHTAGVEVVQAQGEVLRAGADGARAPLSQGDVVRARESVVVGEGAKAVLGVGEGTRLELEARSTLRVVDVDATGLRVELEQGRVSARVRAGSTPLGLTSRGRAIYADDADFTVAVDGEGALAVQPDRGQVRVEGLAGEGGAAAQAAVGEGTRLLALPGRSPVIEAVPSELLLEVGWPTSPSTRQSEVTLEGRTGPFAEVQIGGAEGWTRVRAGPDGRFHASVPLQEGENRVQVHATDTLGNRREDEVSLTRDSTAPTISGSEVQWGP
ncbi:hypothetical protein L6R53_23890 [Myxococcota bacterium]|nr:hypothetical protein [Myxococcota bacterium]